MFRRGHSRNLVLTSRQSHPWFCVSVLFQGTTGNILNTSHPQSAPPVIWLCLQLTVTHILLPRLLFLWAWDVFKVTKRAYSNIACFSRARRRQDSLVYDFFIHPVCFFVVSFTLCWHEQEIPQIPVQNEHLIDKVITSQKVMCLILMYAWIRTVAQHLLCFFLTKQIRGDLVMKATCEDGQRIKWRRGEGEPGYRQANEKGT